MITTLCLNPSFDRTVQVDRLTVGGTNRIRASRTDAGGKGVNVLRVCDRLGSPACCVMLAGEDSIARFRSMLARQNLADSIVVRGVPGEIRTNTKIVSLQGQPLTELNEPGPAVDEAAMVDISSMLASCEHEGDWLVLTGSLPPGCGKGTYARLMALCRANCILDVGGAQLMLGLSAHPFLIKPNLDELSQAVGSELNTLPQIISAAGRLMNLGARNVLVSMGGEGALLVTPEGRWFAPALPVTVSSTVGAGDAMVGGLLTMLSRGESLLQAFRYAVACGAASVMTEGTQLVRPADVAELLPRVTIGEC